MKTSNPFDLPMRLVRGDKQKALQALYDFYCAARDAENCNAQDGKKQLMALRTTVYNIYGNPKLQSSDPLKSAIGEYALTRDCFDAILDGMEMGANGQMVRPGLEQLSLYCYRVASCAGLLAISILGAKRKAEEKFALALGHAVALTHIICSLNEDAARGRLYLPKEWLSEEGIGDIAPEQLQQHKEAVTRVCGKLASLAERFYLEAEALSRLCSRRTLRPLLVLRDIYLQMFLERTVDNDFLGPRKFHFGFWQKLRIRAGALRYLLTP